VRQRPAALSELTYCWSYCILSTLLGLRFKDRPAGRGWKERVEFFQAEFHDVRTRTALSADTARLVSKGDAEVLLVDSHCHALPHWFEPVEVLLHQMDANGVEKATLVQVRGQLDNRIDGARDRPAVLDVETRLAA
jgi:hypothetical protein